LFIEVAIEDVGAERGEACKADLVVCDRVDGVCGVARGAWTLPSDEASDVLPEIDIRVDDRVRSVRREGRKLGGVWSVRVEGIECLDDLGVVSRVLGGGMEQCSGGFGDKAVQDVFFGSEDLSFLWGPGVGLE
jgi:hypothetical protein